MQPSSRSPALEGGSLDPHVRRRHHSRPRGSSARAKLSSPSSCAAFPVWSPHSSQRKLDGAGEQTHPTLPLSFAPARSCYECSFFGKCSSECLGSLLKLERTCERGSQLAGQESGTRWLASCILGLRCLKLCAKNGCSKKGAPGRLTWRPVLWWPRAADTMTFSHFGNCFAPAYFITSKCSSLPSTRPSGSACRLGSPISSCSCMRCCSWPPGRWHL